MLHSNVVTNRTRTKACRRLMLPEPGVSAVKVVRSVLLSNFWATGLTKRSGSITALLFYCCFWLGILARRGVGFKCLS